ncbi:MAG: hypothetical protein OXF79_19405 [Chloroflexi bacterium]|nr:hypothetical protein [Chloroflexota bacterium]
MVVRLTRPRRSRVTQSPAPSRTPRGRNATELQLDYIEDLCLELGREPPEGFETLSRAEVNLFIDELKDELREESRR